MSVKIIDRVWQHSPQKGSTLLLLLALADNANDNGVCYPGTIYSSDKVRMSERQTQRLFDYLEKTAEVYVRRPEIQGRGERNYYLVLTGMSDDQILKGLLELRLKKGDILSKVVPDLKVKRVTFCQKKGDILTIEKLPDFSLIVGPRKAKRKTTTVIEPSYNNTVIDPSDLPIANSDDSEIHLLRKQLDEALAEIAALKSKVTAPAKPKEPLPWSALTLAMHNGIPEKIRPVRAAYHKHNTDAKALFQAGITAEQVSDFVQWKYATDHWMWTGSNNSPVMITMSMVAQNINASSEKVRDWVLKGRMFRAENVPPPARKSNEPDSWREEPIEGNPGAFRRIPVWND